MCRKVLVKDEEPRGELHMLYLERNVPSSCCVVSEEQRSGPTSVLPPRRNGRREVSPLLWLGDGLLVSVVNDLHLCDIHRLKSVG